MTDKERKEIAERLRDMSNRIGSLTQSSLKELADELDPQRPEPGTLVLWRHKRVTMDWKIGEADYGGVWCIRSQAVAIWNDIEWKPTRILADDEVALDIESANCLVRDLRKMKFYSTAKMLEKRIQEAEHGE